MIKFIEGFDVTADRPDQNLFGVRDFSTYFDTNALQVDPENEFPGFAPGAVEGRCFVKRGIRDLPVFGGRYTANNRPGPMDELHIYWWMRVEGGNPAHSRWPYINVNWGGARYSVDAKADGTLMLSNRSFVDAQTGGGTIYPGTHTWERLPWSAFYMHVTSTGFCTLYINGVAVLTAQGDVPTLGSEPSFNFGSCSDTETLYMDHIIIADEPIVRGTELSYSVTVTFDSWEYTSNGGPLSSGIQGALILDNVLYKTSGKFYGGVGSRDLGSTDWTDVNRARIVYFTFPVDPSTGEGWRRRPDSFGVCSVDMDGVKRIRVGTTHLSVVAADPYPRVVPMYPAETLNHSGNWELYGAGSLVESQWEIPRGWDPEQGFMYTATDGCIQFRVSRYPVIFGLTFAEERRTDYRDWEDAVSIDYPFESYFVSGFTILADANKKFQSNYVTFNYEPVDNGGAYAQGIWDYSLSGDTGRWGSNQQLYSNTDPRYSNRMRRLKVRGHGKILQIKVKSEDYKPFSINGWSTFATSNGSV